MRVMTWRALPMSPYTLESSLGVTGITTLSAALGVTGAVTTQSTLSVGGNVVVGRDSCIVPGVYC